MKDLFHNIILKDKVRKMFASLIIKKVNAFAKSKINNDNNNPVQYGLTQWLLKSIIFIRVTVDQKPCLVY